MKNFYFILLIALSYYTTKAQTIYSHVQSFRSVGGQAFVCAQEGTGIMLGSSFAVGYDLQNTFGVNQKVDISGVEILVATTAENRELIVNLYESSSLALDTSTKNLVRSTQYTFTDPVAFSGYRTIHFDQPYTVSPGTILAVEIVIENDMGKPDSPFFVLGATAGPTYTGITYVKAPNCGYNDYIETDIFYNGYQYEQYVINLVGGNLSVHDTFMEKPIEIYPNPVSNVLNVKVQGNESIKRVILYNAEGKEVPVTYYNGQINVSHLAGGIYFLEFLTNKGAIKRKVMIE